MSSIILLQSIVIANAIAPGAPGTRYRVYGYVKENGTSDPIAGATVKIYSDLEGYKGTTSTSSSGYFSIYVYCNFVEGFRAVVTKSGYISNSKFKIIYGSTTVNMGTIYLTSLTPPTPPVAPVIDNVQVDVGELKDVTVSWNVNWGSGATTYNSKLYWSFSSAMTEDDVVYTSSSSSTNFAVSIPYEKLTVSSFTYWFRIYSSNGNSGGSTSSYWPTNEPSMTSISCWHFLPTDDAYISIDAPNNNYNDANLVVKSNDDAIQYPTYEGQNTIIMFDIPYPEYVKSAKLRAMCFSEYSGGHGSVYACSMSTYWDEATATWNSIGESQSEWMIDSDSTSNIGDWDEWDITSAILPSGKVSVRLASDGTYYTYQGAEYYSKEYSNIEYRPRLVVEYWGRPQFLGFHDDCSDVQDWNIYGNRIINYDRSWPFPLSSPWDGYLLTYGSGGDSYFSWSPATSPPSESGTLFQSSLTDFPLASLDTFIIETEHIGLPSVSIGSIGKLQVALYDVNKRPVIEVCYEAIKDRALGEILDIYVIHYDRNLQPSSPVYIENNLPAGSRGTVCIRYDSNDGIIAEYDGNSFIVADTNRIDSECLISYVAFQFTKSLVYMSDAPDLRLHDIAITPKSTRGTDLEYARWVRSGPKRHILQKPGPTTEVQIFPSGNEGLTFCVDTIPDVQYNIYIDAIPVHLSVPTYQSYLEIYINDNLIDIHPLYLDPSRCSYTGDNLYRGTLWYCQYEEIEIKLVPNGDYWDNDDIVAFRGIWMELNYDFTPVDIVQKFPSSKELTYFVPMGQDTNLELDWDSPEGNLLVEVDGESITYSDPSNIVLGDYIHETLHALKLVYTGSSDCTLSVMHVSHFWMHLEIDYIDYPSVYAQADGNIMHFPQHVGYDDFTQYLTDMWNEIKDYYNEYTHGRVTFQIDDSIPYDSTIEQGDGYTPELMAQLGETWYNHKDDSSYMWVIYGDNLAGPGGYRFDNDAANGYEFWVGIAIQWHHLRSATWHELGHASHMDHDLCGAKGCVMGGTGGPPYGYCQYHRYATYLNMPDAARTPAMLWWLL